MITVVVPLFNKEISIKSSIYSVLNQSYANFELVIINDGSTDQSLEQAKSFDDKRIKIFSKKNGGVSSARNFGIEKAKYEWIAFLDGDDLWLPDHLSVLYKLLKKYPDEKVFSTSYKLSNSTEEINSTNDYFIIDNYFKEIQINENFFCSSCALIHKSCFSAVGRFNENLTRGEDLEMWYRLGKSYSFVKSKYVTAIYRVDAENRAMSRKTSFEESFASVIDFKDIDNKYEHKYLKAQIQAKLKSCLYRKEWNSLLKLCIRFKHRLL